MNGINGNKLIDFNSSIFPFLVELRRRLIYCMALFFGLLFLLLPFSVDLYRGLAHPLLNQLAGTQLIASTLIAPLFIPLKFTIITAVFLVIPFMFYQFWLFVSPALYLKERRPFWVILVISNALFYSGVLFSYQFFLPFFISFFIRTTPAYITILPDIGQFLDFSLQLMLSFGLIFEIPLLIIVAVVSGYISLKKLSHWRRYFIVMAFVIAMFLTPPDVVSQFLLAVPICLLFEISLLICRFLPRNQSASL